MIHIEWEIAGYAATHCSIIQTEHHEGIGRPQVWGLRPLQLGEESAEAWLHMTDWKNATNFVWCWQEQTLKDFGYKIGNWIIT